MFFKRMLTKWSRWGAPAAGERDVRACRKEPPPDPQSIQPSRLPAPVCFAYLRELVVLSNGDVTTCCFDSKGVNILGNINHTPLGLLWQQGFLPWHRRNVEANTTGSGWDSPLCRLCLEKGYMSAFNAKVTDDGAMIEHFHRLSHPFPVSLVLEPAAVCNYSCRGCSSGLRELDRNGFLDMNSFYRHLMPVIPEVKQVRLYNYGEPFLHPRINDIIRSLRKANPALCLYLSTNGMLMNDAIARTLVESRVNFLTISLHGGHTQKGLIEYARSRPEIQKIKANIENLVRLKRQAGEKLPWVCLKALLFNWNDSEEEMEDFLRFGRGLGVDFVGWALNSSDPAFSSVRVAPGTQPYQRLVERKLLEDGFYQLPAWPSG